MHRSNLGRLPSWVRLLKHNLQGHTRGLVSQLHVSSGEPHLVTTATRIFPGVEAKLVLLDPPFAHAFVAHRSDRKSSVSLQDLTPMRFIGQLHASELRLNLCSGELLKFLLGRCTRPKRNGTKQPDHCCSHVFLFLRRRHISTAFLPTTNAVAAGPKSPFLASKAVGSPYGAPDVAPITDRSERQLFALAVLSSAERSPLASFTVSSFAQKWRKNSRGCSLSMWLCTAVTSMPLDRKVLMTGFTSSPVRTKSPVMAALPPPVGWKPIAVASPSGPTGAICMPFSLIGSRRGTPN